ncbi:MAG: DUF2326 domain-containing protein [Defluviitaleaceae bacterium]|nr:DUF2326 domain-containing protein [Defluviitaleaceae bacterium]
MHIKRLKIYNSNTGEEIRNISFKIGLNIIADNTSINLEDNNGNAVGKTTILAIIDYCLGGDVKNIYADPENRKNINESVKKFLEENNIIIELTLVENLNNTIAKKIIIERGFAGKGNSKIRTINGDQVSSDKDFRYTDLPKYIFDLELDKSPSFPQIIAHSIRYKNERIENTLKVLGSFGKIREYEFMYLFLFLGEKIFNIANYDNKKTTDEVKSLRNSLKEILKGDTIENWKAKLNVIHLNINDLEHQKNIFVINENYEKDINTKADLENELKLEKRNLEALKYRKELIKENLEELEKGIFTEEKKTLLNIYKEYTSLASKTQTIIKFEELIQYHNTMNKNKISFFEKDIFPLDEKISKSEKWIKEIVKAINNINAKFQESISFNEYNRLIANINEKYEEKGRLEERIDQVIKIEKKLESFGKDFEDNLLYSDEFFEEIKNHITKFNEYFAKVSQELYDTNYYIYVSKEIEDKSKLPVYKFGMDEINKTFSSGDKQGEALCFDIAYCQYAKDYAIPHFDFILNDKKELLDSTKILKAKEIAERNDIQLVFPMLRDKIEKHKKELEKDIILELSKENKLFRF